MATAFISNYGANSVAVVLSGGSAATVPVTASASAYNAATLRNYVYVCRCGRGLPPYLLALRWPVLAAVRCRGVQIYTDGAGCEGLDATADKSD